MSFKLNAPRFDPAAARFESADVEQLLHEPQQRVGLHGQRFVHVHAASR